MCLYFSSSCIVSESENENIYTHFTAAINPELRKRRLRDEGKNDEGKSVERNYTILQSTQSSTGNDGVQRFVARYVLKVK
jgi:hypothetical protein